jgi:low temperature requirement protein LtrA
LATRPKSIQEVAAEAASQPSAEGIDEERVTSLELFFDLVFVFAITQVTAVVTAHATWSSLGRGVLVLAVVWWAWVGYAWLTNWLDTEEDRTRLVLFVAMGAMFVVALAIPGAFGREGLLFAIAYSVVRIAHILLYGYAANDVDVEQAVRRFTPTVLAAMVLLVAASFLEGPARPALWLLAIVVDYGGALRRNAGWKLHPGHFAERHGLIVIIAFGESIVATGLGAQGVGLSASVVAAALLGMVVAAALWWAYFDVVALVAERHLREAEPEAQARMARDSYSYIHLMLIAGIVLVAVGAKKTLAHVEEPLALVPAVALCGGVSLYLLGHVAFRLRNIGTLNRQRLVVAVVAAALIPVATRVEALITLALVACLTGGLIAYEARRFSEVRARIRVAVRT